MTRQTGRAAFPKYLLIILSGIYMLLSLNTAYGQARSSKGKHSTQAAANDSTKSKVVKDTTQHYKVRMSKDSLDAPVDYSADDSTIYDVANEKVYLYNNAEVKYKDIDLKAYYIQFDWKTSIVVAYGKTDTVKNKIIGSPVFKQGTEEYDAKRIAFNFKTKKGKITDLYTAEEGGFMLAKIVKKNPDNSYYAKDNEYTTCNYKDHPDFYLKSYRVKVIPDKVIISGPANLVLEGVPTPLFVPFAIFPIHKHRTSGIIFPEYGNRADLGYFLSNGGYYFAFSDYLDLAVKGDIYSRGSYRTELSSNYKKRYKYSGNIDLNYAKTRTFDYDALAVAKENDFSVRWSFVQDPKSSPKSHFSASVNFATSGYNKTYAYTANDYLNNTYQSSISYQRTLNDLMNFSLSLDHSSSTATHLVSVDLPTFSFNVSRFTPFKKKNSSSTPKWYEKIGISYTLNAQNTVTQADSLFFRAQTLKRFSNGLKESVPISTSFNLFKYLNISPSINFDHVMYLQSIREHWDSAHKMLVTDTVPGLVSGIDFNASISMSTKLYGTVNFKKGKVKAIRHVLTPTLGVSYQPDFGAPNWGSYKVTQYDSAGDKNRYSIFQNGAYGGPPNGKFGGINFGVDNNLEMKVYSKKDTVSHTKKVTLLESFAITGNYNLAVDTLRLSPISVTARTTLLNKLNIVFSSTFDPYAEDSFGRRINRFDWDVNHQIARLTNANLSLGGSFNSPKTKTPVSTGNPDEREMIKNNPNAYVDFNVPWNVSAYYTLSLNKLRQNGRDTSEITESVSVNFDLKLTTNWKVTGTVNYDIQNHDFSYSTLEIYRDLHCWQMSIRWVPFGTRQGYYVSINVKSSVLQDLKLSKKSPDWGTY